MTPHCERGHGAGTQSAVSPAHAGRYVTATEVGSCKHAVPKRDVHRYSLQGMLLCVQGGWLQAPLSIVNTGTQINKICPNGAGAVSCLQMLCSFLIPCMAVSPFWVSACYQPLTCADGFGQQGSMSLSKTVIVAIDGSPRPALPPCTLRRLTVS